MEKISGYVRVLARTRIKQLQNKPFIGKPYIKMGQCFGICSYFLQLGGILGAKYFENLDIFGNAFLGSQGPDGAVKEFFTDVAEFHNADSKCESMTFLDYINTELIKRVNYECDAKKYLLKHGNEKLQSETVEELSYQFSIQGAALGAITPHIIKEMFNRTHEEVPKEDWKLAYDLGLNIPSEQEKINYEDTLKVENDLFVLYCKECCPENYIILKD